MINRFFLISDTVFQAGENLPEGDNIYFSLLVNPLDKGDLENAYSFIDSIKPSQFALTLNIGEPLSAESIRFIASFLFLPAYLRIEQQPVINLRGNSKELLGKTTSALTDYLSSQRIDVIINKVSALADQSETNSYRLFDSSNKLLEHYKEVLQSDQYYDNRIFFYASSIEVFHSALLSLQEAENEFRQNSLKPYLLANDKLKLEKEIGKLKRKIIYTETELGHQKQYSDILRSDHSTKELQDYYDHEYEILPLWYKRFGHILKVITGKRTLKSLFRDDVKKYKD